MRGSRNFVSRGSTLVQNFDIFFVIKMYTEGTGGPYQTGSIPKKTLYPCEQSGAPSAHQRNAI